MEKASNPSTPSEWLKIEYERRVRKNPYYSQRAFARSLGLSPGRLSDVLLGKRNLGRMLAKRVADRLNYSPAIENSWLRSVASTKASRSRSSKVLRLISNELLTREYSELSDDAFKSIADWNHVAILSLMQTEDFKSDLRWVSKRLGIPLATTTQAWLRLRRLNLIHLEGKRWVRTNHSLQTSQDIPSAAIRQAHGSVLEKAIRSLEESDVHERDITNVSMAIDLAKLPLAKNLIRNFRRALVDLLHSGNKTEVYNLSVALFPLSKTTGSAKCDQ